MDDFRALVTITSTRPTFMLANTNKKSKNTSIKPLIKYSNSLTSPKSRLASSLQIKYRLLKCKILMTSKQNNKINELSKLSITCGHLRWKKKSKPKHSSRKISTHCGHLQAGSNKRKRFKTSCSATKIQINARDGSTIQAANPAKAILFKFLARTWRHKLRPRKSFRNDWSVTPALAWLDHCWVAGIKRLEWATQLVCRTIELEVLVTPPKSVLEVR